ncbi:galactitol-1-phosphate 5-dehydrogenase [Marinithermofilum abyssi]|uniref:Galactitol-1-phosphate 5-dehydrogenase n=1 Tax=Marinithermofilum abyssi TaxID=1571185 RepID=A0A8J2VGL7_9BACL|nr:galactitol-1-phosphate 5-dehydrogenase [Marinithermofilum abyssi]GGE08377.1 galactitol-1-phosphate 5-dehydrogenase [Marinithermofilum abyssi]
MNALKLYGIGDLRYGQAKLPIIEMEDEVVIRVKAAGICGSDLSRYRKLGPYVEGMVLGHEFTGVVEAVGNAVTHVSPGDRVAACPAIVCGTCESCLRGAPSQCIHLTVIGSKQPGCFAEFTKLPAANVLPLPEGIAYETAALIEPSAVAVHGLYLTHLRPGGSVAVLGCGNIGLLTIQWAKLFGAETVYAIDLNPRKLSVAKQMGADIVIHPKKKSAYDQLMAATDGNGVDLAVEAAGSSITSAQVFALPRKGGEVVFMGIPYGDVPIERFYFEKIVRNELKVYGSWNAVSAPFPGKEWTTTLHMMSTGQLDVTPMITHRLPLSEGPKAFEDMINQKDFFGKVLLYPE